MVKKYCDDCSLKPTEFVQKKISDAFADGAASREAEIAKIEQEKYEALTLLSSRDAEVAELKAQLSKLEKGLISPAEAKRTVEGFIQKGRREVLYGLKDYIHEWGINAIFPEDWQSDMLPKWQAKLKEWGLGGK